MSEVDLGKVVASDGVTPILRKSDTAIEVSIDNGKSFSELVSLSDLKGPKGDPAENQIKSFAIGVSNSNWSDTSPYSKTIKVTGLKGGDVHLYLSPQEPGQPTEEEEQAFACITGGTTAADSITLYCRDEKPTVYFNIRIEEIS